MLIVWRALRKKIVSVHCINISFTCITTKMKWKVFGFLLENLRQSSEIFCSLRESVSAKMPKIKLLHVIEPTN